MWGVEIWYCLTLTIRYTRSWISKEVQVSYYLRPPSRSYSKICRFLLFSWGLGVLELTLLQFVRLNCDRAGHSYTKSPCAQFGCVYKLGEVGSQGITRTWQTVMAASQQSLHLHVFVAPNPSAVNKDSCVHH